MVRGFNGARSMVLGWGSVLAIALGVAGSARGQAVGKLDFNRDVRPILSGSCLKCHGIDDKARKSGLRLDVREAALAPAKSGKIAIVPGKVSESELVKRVLTEDEDDMMPPPSMKRSLTDSQKQVLKRWVAEGAEYRPHWAFVAPKRPAIPAVTQKDWGRNGIDAFVLAKLEAEGLAPSPEANKYTLARRVYLDLIGLPPTPAEADAFVKDGSPDAFEKLVDRLLASPQYGERWARKWLDLARYSDTNGYEKDKPRSMWPYRDWVIEAINKDMPFDQFTVEQLAGDMLPNSTLSQKVATGFHRNTMINEEGGIDPLEYRFHSMVDRVGTTGTTWLGLTVMCAQCHTHKYDPIRHEEYYGLMAALDNADEPVMELAGPEILAKRAEANARADGMMARLAEEFPVRKEKGAWSVAGGTLTTQSGAKAERVDDGSWRIGGEAPDKDTYTLLFETDGAGGAVDRIKLETLMDGSAGPGRTAHGNFVLTEIVVEVAEKSGAAKRVKIARAEADFSQVKFSVSDAIDGSSKTGWGVAGEPVKNRVATFYFEKPVNFAGGTKWTVRLEQQYGGKHTIARPRVSVGTLPAAVAKVEDSVEARKAAAEKAFGAWEAEKLKSAARWSSLRPTKLVSNAPTLTLLDDWSVLVSGDITKSDTYDLGFISEQGGITAIRVEAMTDPSLPNNGPGKVHYEGPTGDFFLSEIGLSVDGAAAKFVSAAQSFAAGKNGADKAIDGDQQSGWSINGGQGKAQHAVFVLEKPTARAKELSLRMLFEKYYAADIGRFRIWVSRDPGAGKSAPLPPDVENALLSSKRTEEQNAELFSYWLSVAPELAEARKAVEAVRNSVPKPPTTLVMKEREAGHARATHLRNRGEFTQPKDLVKAGVPAFLSTSGVGVRDGNASDAKPQAASQSMDRLAFARWLVSGENPLTARVTVNRQWAAFFGRGIVRTTEDFGFQGESPSNPDLLDYLSEEFVRPSKEGDAAWSMKRMHRLIVTSAAYRQSSRVTPELLAKDPQNVLISRGPRVREEAEVVRDSMLKAAGLLSAKMGGPSVFPPQPASITTEGAYGPLKWVASAGEDRYRRSLYTFSKRTAPFALYSTFDAPTGDACVARREVSNTPLQALSLLNDEIFVEVAQAMGKQLAAEKGTDAEKLAGLFRKMLTRPAEGEEVEMLVSFASQQRARFKERAAEAKKVAGGEEGDAVERAVWVVVARAVMNLDEVVTKN